VLFPTVDFGIFFVLVFAASWFLRRRDVERKIFLTAASYFFYGYWDWSFMALLAGVTVLDYLFGLALGAVKNQGGRKALVALAAILNLGVLGYFKYTTFLLESGNAALRLFGLPLSLPIIQVILPVGISFFTFQAMSYVIDVYRREIPAEKSLLDLALFISFFPQLVAGPIVRAKDFIPQLKSAPSIGDVPVGRALFRIAGGLFKKVIVANYLSSLWADRIFQAPMDFGPVDVILGVYAYAIVIYCDFSAYSEIAIGTASLLGYHFPPNFDQPYRALSLKDFWRRWHISLSTWLRDYLYLPLGGNRKGKIRTYVNLIITMLLGGLWHGAALKFAAWGLLHGSGLAMERAIREKRASMGKLPSANPFVKILKFLLVFNFVCLGWVFFRAADFRSALEVFQAMLPRPGAQAAILVTPFLLSLLCLGMLMQFFPRQWSEAIIGRFERISLTSQALAMGGFLVVLSAMSQEGVAPFIYFQF
jgi:alginate O-acetyltransferase complex protein AlgI